MQKNNYQLTKQKTSKYPIERIIEELKTMVWWYDLPGHIEKRLTSFLFKMGIRLKYKKGITDQQERFMRDIYITFLNKEGFTEDDLADLV